MPFDAFISYSHAADGALAPAVQRALQSLARPWNRRRALEVFRDQTGLAVSPGLWSSICAGLDDSKHFVLLASPEAAASTWVNQEIARWAGSHPVDQLLPVVTAGEWIWDTDAGDFDWNRSTAVPETLRGRFVEEPHYLDLRWARNETELDLRHGRFREAMTQLAAPMHGVSPQDLESSDVARFRHVVRLRRAVVSALCVLLILVSVAGVLALQNAQEAREQQALAEEQAERALSLQLLAQAEVIGDDQTTLSLLLTAEAARLAPGEAWASLVRGVDGTRGLTQVFDLPRGARQDGAAEAVDLEAGVYAVAPPGGDLQPTIQLWSLDSGDRVGPVDSATGEVLPLSSNEFYGFTVTQLVFSPDGTLAAVYECSTNLGACADAPAEPSRRSRAAPGGIQLSDVGTGRGELLPDSGMSSNVTFSHGGDRVAAMGPDRRIRVWDVTTRRIETTLPPVTHRAPIALAFSSDDTMLAVSGRHGGQGHILVWDLASRGDPEPVDITTRLDEAPRQMAFGSALLATLARSGRVHLWRVDSGTSAGRLKTGSRHVSSVAFDPAGGLATADADGSLRLWHVERRSQQGSAHASGPRGVGAEVRYTRDGGLVSMGADIRYWDTSQWEQTAEALYRQGAVTAVAVSPDGVVASGDTRGVVKLWDLDTAQPWGSQLPPQPTAVTALAFSSSGMLGSGGEDGSVRLWDPATGEGVEDPLTGHDGVVRGLSFSPGGETVAAGYEARDQGVGQQREAILVWNVASGSVVERLDVGRAGGVESVAFSSDGAFASAGVDSLAVWDVDTWLFDLLDSRGGPYAAVAFTADGRTLAASATSFGSDPRRTVAMWDARSRDPLGPPLEAGSTGGEAGVFRSLAFTPDGTLLAGAGPGGVQIWDAARRQPIGPRLGAAHATSVAASPDSLQIIAGGTDGFVRSYPATIDGWLSRVCAVVSRNLSQGEWETFVGTAAPYHRTCPGLPG